MKWFSWIIDLLSRLWPEPKPDVPTCSELAIYEDAFGVGEIEECKIILSLTKHEHLLVMEQEPIRAYKWSSATYPGLPRARLREEVIDWLEENAPGYRYNKSRACNWFVDIYFADEMQGMMFKLRWM